MTLTELIEAKLDANAKVNTLTTYYFWNYNLNLKSNKKSTLKQEILCTTKATITEIIPNFGWYYLACNHCFKKIRDTSDKKQCYNCPNIQITPAYKYKVIVKVEDATATTTFTMFDRQVITLIGVPVQHIMDTYEVRFLIILTNFNTYSGISLYLYNVLNYHRQCTTTIHTVHVKNSYITNLQFIIYCICCFTPMI